MRCKYSLGDKPVAHFMARLSADSESDTAHAMSAIVRSDANRSLISRTAFVTSSRAGRANDISDLSQSGLRRREAIDSSISQIKGSSDIDIMIDRLQKVASLKPEKRLVGSNGMQNYIGYQFGDDFVAFENPRLGNALYLMYGDWQALSKRSRTELLSGQHGSSFDRIIHTARWFDRLRMAVYDYRRHRD